MASSIDYDPDGVARCWWALTSAAMTPYHDNEWGRPTADDRWIFEKICLEGFQSGLSSRTILEKRENFRGAFANFDIETIAQFGRADVDRLVQNASIVRNRRKIESTINNARRAIELGREFGSLAAFVWKFAPSQERLSAENRAALAGRTRCPESEALSKELKRRGFSFVGPTTMYAFMQASGMVNDHLAGCSAGTQCEDLRAQFSVPRPR